MDGGTVTDLSVLFEVKCEGYFCFSEKGLL